MANAALLNILDHPGQLIQHVRARLADRALTPSDASDGRSDRRRSSAVLMAITASPAANGADAVEPCLILNKRSQKVRQPGDLCYPGGGIHILDKALSKVMQLPGLPLAGRVSSGGDKSSANKISSKVKQLLATSLREAWEEMRLNPFRVRFLGALPPQRLVMFEHVIQPLVGWVRPGQRFRPNWEVDRIVYIPLRQLLNQNNYGRYHLSFSGNSAAEHRGSREFPCYLHQGRAASELLWGASFRITMDFLRIAFDFYPPVPQNLPIYQGRLGKAYLTGSRLDNRE